MRSPPCSLPSPLLAPCRRRSSLAACQLSDESDVRARAWEVRLCYQFEDLFEQPAERFVSDLRSLATNNAMHEVMCGSTGGGNGAIFNWAD